MKLKLSQTVTAGILLLAPYLSFAQAPALGTARNFVLFSSVGAVTNSGIPHLTHLTGNVGTNSGSSTGFGNVDGQMHDGDVASAACAADLLTAYIQLDAAIPTASLSTLLGNDDTLTAGVYFVPAAASMNGLLTLDGEGDPNTVFIFQVEGSFSVNAAAKVRLINGALACNVFWKVEGMVDIATDVTMKGTIVAHNASINLSVNDTLEGRALSINGALSTNAILAYMPIGCGSTLLTGPAAPALGSAAAYGAFSAVGPVTNSGVTYIFGDVGSNSDLTAGFDPLFVTGMIHEVADGSTAACAADLNNAYSNITALPADIELLFPAQFGNNLVLTPHIYHMGAAASFTGSVFLNAQGYPDAIFIIQIDGALTTSMLCKVVLINGTKAKNVYWKINGAVNVGTNSIFNGNIIGAGAITLNTGDTINGRALTINGAVNMSGGYIDNDPPPCVASAITGTMTVCVGATTTLSNVDTGGTWTSSNITIATIDTFSGVVTGVAQGTAIVTYISGLACEITDTVTVNPLPISGTITGTNHICPAATTTLANSVAGGVWSASNTNATVGTSGIVTGVTPGIDTISYSVTNMCGTATATMSVTVDPLPDAGSISGPSNVCPAATITLTNSATGGVWSASNTNASVSTTGIVTGNTIGVDTISYTVTNSCGTASSTKTVTVNTTPDAGTISGPANVCPAAAIALTNTATGGVWSASNTNASVSSTGIVTGNTAGTVLISYTVTNSCGTSSTTKSVTVNPLPNAGSISGSSAVCPTATITLTNTATGGVWSASNANASVSSTGIVTGNTAGTVLISYTVTNSCGTSTTTKSVTVNPLPNAGSISGLSVVCPTATITLTNTATGGVWSASNANATVGITGTVTGVTAGTVLISYSVTNSCGTANTTKSVTVNPAPSAGSISGSSNVCPAATIALTNAATGGVWSASNANASVSSTGVVTGNTAGTVLISYAVTNSCGAASTTKPITVNPMPNAGDITGPSGVCLGSSVTFIATISGGTWSSTSANVSVSSGVVTGLTVGSADISYTVANMCGVASMVTTITVNALPVVPVISIQSPASVCTGTMYQNFGTSATLPAGSVYNWTAVNATVWAQGADNKNAVINFDVTGTASVSLTTTIAATGCNSKNTVIINVGAATAQTDEVSYFKGHFVCTPGADRTYQWGYDNANTLDSTILTGEINQDYVNPTPDFANKYYWVITTHNGCTQKTYYRAPSAIEDANPATATVKVYPNPATTILNVEVSTVSTGNMEVEIWNMMGQKVNTARANDKMTSFNIADLASGTYIVNCSIDGNKITAAKFFKN